MRDKKLLDVVGILHNLPVVCIEHPGIFMAHLLSRQGSIPVHGKVVGTVGMPEDVIRLGRPL